MKVTTIAACILIMAAISLPAWADECGQITNWSEEDADFFSSVHEVYRAAAINTPGECHICDSGQMATWFFCDFINDWGSVDLFIWSFINETEAATAYSDYRDDPVHLWNYPGNTYFNYQNYFVVYNESLWYENHVKNFVIVAVYRGCVIRFLGSFREAECLTMENFESTYMQVLDQARSLIDSICNEPTIELTYPAGQSPKVFTQGWVFGARCTLNGEDISDRVHWSGTGTFNPQTGSSSSPRFSSAGSNRIELSVQINGQEYREVYGVEAVYPFVYAKMGDTAMVQYVGGTGILTFWYLPITSGSPNVTINGLPAARVGDTGANGIKIITGDENVLIDGLRAARIGDEVGGPGWGFILMGCASFDVQTTTLHVPSLELAGASEKSIGRGLENSVHSETRTLYWVDLLLTSGDTLTFTLGDFGIWEGSGGSATFDVSTNTLHIPYLYMGGSTNYWLDLVLTEGDQIDFQLTGYDENWN